MQVFFSSLLCLGKWGPIDADSLQCVRGHCPNPGILTKARHMQQDFRFGEEVMMETLGRNGSQPTRMRCQEDGKWHNIT